MTRRPIPAASATGRRFVWLLLLLLPAPLLASPSAVADEHDRDLERPPPWIFFDEPDAATAQEIHEVVSRSFADQNHVIPARALLVRRYGVLSARKIHEVLEEDKVEPFTWNAALSAYALRNEWGNARELWRLLPPLLELADDASEPYRRAFAALALGAFRSLEFAPERPVRTDAELVRVPEDDARKSLEALLPVLGRQVDHYHPHVRVAVALALGKSGGPGARTLLRDEERLGLTDVSDAHFAPRQAVVIAIGLLPGQDDEPRLHKALQDIDRRARHAGALAVSLQALHRPQAPEWTRKPTRILRDLKTTPPMTPQLEDGAEAVFTRGVLAALGAAPREWQLLFDLAQRPSTEKLAARSAAQALLFCEEPWFIPRARIGVKEGVDLKPVVLASFLLRLGTNAGEEDVDLCARFLGTNTRRPKGKPTWDVRFFAVIGLLRALASGRLTDEDRRAEILNALDEAVKRGLRQGPFREALRRLLELERRPLEENPNRPLPEERVLKVERSFKDPDGLLVQDLQDMVVVRLNDMVTVVFNVNNLKPGVPGARDKTEMPRRFLKAAHENFPYFTRLDLIDGRGRRARVEMPKGDQPADEVRRK